MGDAQKIGKSTPNAPQPGLCFYIPSLLCCPSLASGSLLHPQASSFGLHHCCRARLGPHTQQAGQERSPPKLRLPLACLGDLLLPTLRHYVSPQHHDKVAAVLGAGKGLPWAWVGPGGGRRRRVAVPSPVGEKPGDCDTAALCCITARAP